jgi:hypothetical protein
MQTVGDWEEANPTEVQPYGLDFDGALPPGDSIASAEWFALPTVNAEDDPTPSERIKGAATVFGTITTQFAGTFQANVTYAFGATVQTRLGASLTLWGNLNGVPIGC